MFVAAIRRAFWALAQSFREIVVLQRRQSYKHGSLALFDPRRALARVSCTVESELQIFFIGRCDDTFKEADQTKRRLGQDKRGSALVR